MIYSRTLILVLKPFLFVITASICLHAYSQNTERISDTTRVLELLDKAWALKYSNPDSALIYVDQANKINVKGFRNGLIKTYNTLGIIAWGKSDYTEAIRQFNNLLQFSINQKDSVMISKSYNNLGSVFYRMGLMEEAAIHYFKALEIKEKIGADPKSIAMSYNNIGSTYEEIGDSKYAEEHFTKAIDIRKEIGDSSGLSDTYHNLARVYRDQGNFETAEKYFKNAANIKLKLNNLRGLSNTLNSLATLYEMLGEIDSAKHYYDKSIAIAKQASSGYELVQANINRADLLVNNGEIEEAFASFKDWEEPLNNINSWQLKADASSLKSKIYELLGKSDSALLYYKLYVAARDSSATQKNKDYINRLKWQYETEKKELAIESEKRKARYNKIIGYTVSSTLVIILFLLVNRLFTQRKINRIKAEKMEAEIDYKNRLVASKTVDVNNFENLLNDLKERIDQSSKESPESLARNLKKAIKNKLKDVNNWDEVKMHFEEVHPRFFEKIAQIQPPLTPNEQKHAAYIKMKLSNKEIARMLNVNLSSVHVVHHRLKKKLGLSEKESLADYINQV